MPHSPRKSRGFTVLEIIIILVILALLVAMTYPAYRQYLVRMQVAQVMDGSARLRTVIDRCIAQNHLTVGSGADECNPGAVPSKLIADGGNTAPGVALPGGRGVRGVPNVPASLSPTASIVTTFGNAASAQIVNATLSWNRGADGNWTCTSTVPPIYKMPNC